MAFSLKQVVGTLEKMIPLKLAGSWDNVGLLVEPTSPAEIKNVFLTIDLTEHVLEEALQQKSELIICYHPAMFSSVKRLVTREAKDRIIIRCIENKVAVYSPHSALDSVKGGINDWLAEGLGEGTTKPLQPFKDSSSLAKVVVFCPHNDVDRIRAELGKIRGVGQIGNYNNCSFNIPGFGTFEGNENSNPVVGQKQTLEKADEIRLEMILPRSSIAEASRVIKQHHPYEEPAFEFYGLESAPDITIGEGRIVTLKEPAKLTEVINRIKKHLGIDTLRVAWSTSFSSANEIDIKTIAICAGSGSSVLRKVKADLYFTGEMSHHEILASIANDAKAVVLTEHTRCERGYLKILKSNLDKEFQGKLNFTVSTRDADPIRFL